MAQHEVKQRKISRDLLLLINNHCLKEEMQLLQNVAPSVILRPVGGICSRWIHEFVRSKIQRGRIDPT